MLRQVSLGYHILRFYSPLRYLKILLIAIRIDSQGSTWNLAHWHIENKIYCLFVVEKQNELIIPLYLVIYILLPDLY